VARERLEQAHELERELSWQRDRYDPQRQREVRALNRAQTRALRAEQRQRRRG
jgi:hypothetical protein